LAESRSELGYLETPRRLTRPHRSDKNEPFGDAPGGLAITLLLSGDVNLA
jgi:hypothetical protein